MKDAFGNELQVGHSVVYVSRYGSTVTLRVMLVVATIDDSTSATTNGVVRVYKMPHLLAIYGGA